MVKKQKISIIFAVVLSMCMLFTTTVFAVGSNIPEATNQFYINDFANIINDDVEKEMQERAVAFAESTDGIQVVVTTVQTIGDADRVEYTVDMYNKYGIGKNNMGVLIMLSVETRDIQVRLGDNMTKYLSDRKSGEIIDDYGIPYFKNDDFETGLYEMQKATIDYISTKVETANNEDAIVPTDIEDIETISDLNMILGFLASMAGGVLSFFGIDKFLKRREEIKKAEELERIQNSEIVRQKDYQIKNLEAELASEINASEKQINIMAVEIVSLIQKLDATQTELYNLKERYERAIIAYPDLDEKVDSIFAKEQEEFDKKEALRVENKIKNALQLECTRQNLNEFKNACDEFEDLSPEQQKYVSNELVSNLIRCYEESLALQKQFEEEERIRMNKAKAAEVQNLIQNALSYNVSRHQASELARVCRIYEELTREQKRYITADLVSLYAMSEKARRLQEVYEEAERRRRRQREEEERRRREESSYSSSSHSGFGGFSSGHGAGRKF